VWERQTVWELRIKNKKFGMRNWSHEVVPYEQGILKNDVGVQSMHTVVLNEGVGTWGMDCSLFCFTLILANMNNSSGKGGADIKLELHRQVFIFLVIKK
jgi:hypothetical protein